MEIITKREAEITLMLLTFGSTPDEIVSYILKSRLPNLTADITRDVEAIYGSAQKSHEEAILYRTIWEVLKEKGK